MGFVKYEKTVTEYQGESFTKTITRSDGTAWAADDEANYELIDSSGNIVSSGSLVKTGDNLGLTVFVPKADTASISGKHILLIYLTSVSQPTFNDVIAEYTINYKVKKAK